MCYSCLTLPLQVQDQRDTLVILHLPGVCRHFASAFHASADGGGRDDHYALPCCAGRVSSFLYSELDIPVRMLCCETMRELPTRHFCSYWTEDLIDPIAVTSGIVQTALYLDFFYVYFTKYVDSIRAQIKMLTCSVSRLHASCLVFLCPVHVRRHVESYKDRSSNCLHDCTLRNNIHGQFHSVNLLLVLCLDRFCFCP